MSPRAAWRLERLGFSPVYDYTAGKADWLAAGLPTEGQRRARPRVSLVMTADVPRCRPDDRVGDVLGRVPADANMVVVLNDGDVALGRLRVDRAASANPVAAVDEVMEPGPATVRADADLVETMERMDRRGVKTIIVTTPDGAFLGVVRAT